LEDGEEEIEKKRRRRIYITSIILLLLLIILRIGIFFIYYDMYFYKYHMFKGKG